MPTPTFGFRIGDFIAAADVAWTIYKALNGASTHYQELQTELLAFRNVSLQLVQIFTNGSISLDSNQASTAKKVLENFQQSIHKFNKHLTKYGGTAGLDKSYLKRLRWAFSGVDDVTLFQHMIQSHTLAMTLFMQSINGQALQNLSRLVQAGNENLNARLHSCTEEVKLQICATLDEPWDQKPIRFQDAIGRRYPIPLEVAKTFQAVKMLLKYTFQDSPGLFEITHGSMWLFTPNKQQSKTWYLIGEEDWESIIYPGMELGMSLGHKECTALASDPCCLVENDNNLQFETPLPPWATYAEDTEFVSLPRLSKRPAMYLASCPLCESDPTTPKSIIGHASIVKEKIERMDSGSLIQKNFNQSTKEAPEIFRCERRWCGKEFSSNNELQDHLDPKLTEIDMPMRSLCASKYGPGPFVRCKSTISRKHLLETSKVVQRLQNGTDASIGITHCSIAVAKMICRCDMHRYCWYGDEGLKAAVIDKIITHPRTHTSCP